MIPIIDDDEFGHCHTGYHVNKWEAKEKLAKLLHGHVSDKILNIPVCKVRNHQKQLRMENRRFVEEFLKSNKYDFDLSWEITYDYYFKEGTQVVFDVFVKVN